MTSYNQNHISGFFIVQILVFLFSFTFGSNTFAQDPYQRIVKIIDTHDLGISYLSGLAFSPNANAFLSMTTSGTSSSNISFFSVSGDPDGTVRIGASIADPLNMSFDSKENRLLYFDTQRDELVEIKAGADSRPLSSGEAVTHYQLRQLGLNDVQGMAVDPDNGDLYILDAQVPRIVCIVPDSSSRFDEASALNDGRVSNILLTSLQGTELRGIAFNQFDGHFFVASPFEQNLYEVNDQGEILTIRDLSLLELKDTQSMVFAPSGDRTDDPDNTSLYIVDSGLSSGKGGIVELALVQPEQLDLSDITVKVSSFRVRSLKSEKVTVESAATEPSDPSLLAISVNTIFTDQWSPPSPDPAGLAYFPPSNNLLISDSEVNEMTMYAGANVYESSFSGTLLNTENTLNFSTEPTGVAYNPDNQHLYFSDDTGDRWVFEMNPGPDGLLWTSDDIITSFVTDDFGSHDPEGIAFDTWQDHLFLADGVNSEIYEIDPGTNGIFDGVPPDGDDVISQFDTDILGLNDPEGVEFNPFNGNLYIVSGNNDIVVETTRSGTPVRVIDISFLDARSPAGLAYAPNSENPALWSLYISDRGVDNNSDPNENDGKIYEITDDDISLPVELASFTVEIIENNVLLRWITESEIENIGFELMRSDEEYGEYTIITSYKDNIDLFGQGNSSVRHVYSYIDELVEPGKTYWYMLVDLDIYGIKTFHGPVSVTVLQETVYPVTAKIHPNYPNPFNPTTNIKVEIPMSKSGSINIKLVIYNTLGQLVKTLYQEKLSPGIYNIPWDTTTDSGHQAPAGIYYARLSVGAFSQSIKMILLK